MSEAKSIYPGRYKLAAAEAALSEAQQERDEIRSKFFNSRFDDSKTIRLLKAQVAQLQTTIGELREEIKSGDEMYEAQQQKYADCPHKPITGEINECGCSFDSIGDVCAYHAPALKASQAQVAQLQTTISQLSVAVTALLEEHCCDDQSADFDGTTRECEVCIPARAALAHAQEKPHATA